MHMQLPIFLESRNKIQILKRNSTFIMINYKDVKEFSEKIQYLGIKHYYDEELT